MKWIAMSHYTQFFYCVLILNTFNVKKSFIVYVGEMCDTKRCPCNRMGCTPNNSLDLCWRYYISIIYIVLLLVEYTRKLKSKLVPKILYMFLDWTYVQAYVSSFKVFISMVRMKYAIVYVNEVEKCILWQYIY